MCNSLINYHFTGLTMIASITGVFVNKTLPYFHIKLSIAFLIFICLPASLSLYAFDINKNFNRIL